MSSTFIVENGGASNTVQSCSGEVNIRLEFSSAGRMRITQSSSGLLVVGNTTLSEFHLLGLDDAAWPNISLVLGRLLLLVLPERSAVATGAFLRLRPPSVHSDESAF
jgi:hypothetical protein